MKKLVYILLVIVALFEVATNETYASCRVVIRQDMDLVKVFSGENCKYIIKDDINLGGKRVAVGKGSVLVFKGGTISNGTICGANTRVKAKNYEIFKRGFTRYKACIQAGAKLSAPPTLLKEYHDYLFIEGTWNNIKCGSNWTGLQNNSDEDVMPALRNYIVLHKAGVKVNVPHIEAIGYETTYFPNGYSIDFNNSVISYPDDFSIWEDAAIQLPANSKHCEIESGFGFFSLSSNTTISNLTIDGKSEKRQHEAIRLGVSCAICIGSSSNVLLKNVNVTNVLGPGVDVNSGAKDITFQDCYFYNIGEHVFYSHQYMGYCHFIGCTFDTWDSERLSVYRNGLNYLFKYAPPVESENFSFDEAYNFDLSFTDCSFNNPKRIDSHGRTLGGFLTGYCPVVVRIQKCRFTGVQPPFNPGNSSIEYESSGKPYRMIVMDCDGAPYAYPAMSNYNIITEFYNCINLPFRSLYAKIYDNCSLSIDVYENNIENVSLSFEKEFSQPLIIRNCSFSDEGLVSFINHPIIHRPICFVKCSFKGENSREKHAYLINVQNQDTTVVSFESCYFDMPYLRIVGGNGKIGLISINDCVIKRIDEHLVSSTPKEIRFITNRISEEILTRKLNVDMNMTKVVTKNNRSRFNRIIDDSFIK